MRNQKGKTMAAAKSNVVKHPSSKEAPAKAKVKKPAEKKGFEKTIILKLRKDTKGANVYEAVDGKGVSIPQDDTLMPSVYLRKSQMPQAAEFLEVTVRAISGLTAKPKVKTPEVDEEEDD